MLRDIEGIKLVVPESLEESFVSFTTTKFGSFSKGVYNGLNFGFFCGDDLVDVNRNYLLVKKVFDVKRIILLRQVHGAYVVTCDMNTPSFIEGDGLFTKEVGLGLGILTADCFNMQLIGENGSIANLHCGWRSVYEGIIERGLEKFEGEKLKKVIVGVGICEKCFEVREDFVNTVKDRFAMDECLLMENGKMFFNLRLQIEKILLENGVEKNCIEHIRYCSYCNDMFYSYRRDRVTGRMLSFLMRRR
ncbi:laccase domain-containing protein [Deferribacter autotrophicus]|uniref:Laccase domain-containing protein n=1 Tax=Deferribacter autotrophicus TaxID=500465 RepID=A0A5A8F614_9BACT|nr:polyphenol oxidase family protein [Deferribacter autotrophicus]KAA0259185.1 laccase domain-containing protein [Deferribacter autotrophicus]